MSGVMDLTSDDEGATVNQAGAVWSCSACTFENAPMHLACSICSTPRNESTFGTNGGIEKAPAESRKRKAEDGDAEGHAEVVPKKHVAPKRTPSPEKKSSPTPMKKQSVPTNESDESNASNESDFDSDSNDENSDGSDDDELTSELEEEMNETGCGGMYVWCIHIAVSMSPWTWSQRTSDL